MYGFGESGPYRKTGGQVEEVKIFGGNVAGGKDLRGGVKENMRRDTMS